jgi:hypothetical protein
VNETRIRRGKQTMGRLNGKRYKSLNFTLLREKLEEREKHQTYRMLYVPRYEIGEIIMLTFGHKENDKKEFLYLAKITDMYPKQIKDLTSNEALQDGFESVEEFQTKVMELNGIKSKNQWGFIIRFEEVIIKPNPQKTINEFLLKQK